MRVDRGVRLQYSALGHGRGPLDPALAHQGHSWQGQSAQWWIPRRRWAAPAGGHTSPRVCPHAARRTRKGKGGGKGRGEGAKRSAPTRHENIPQQSVCCRTAEARHQRRRQGHFEAPAEIALQRHCEQQNLHENSTHQAHHDRIDERHLLGALGPELPLRRHEALPMAHSSSPRFSSVRRGRWRVVRTGSWE